MALDGRIRPAGWGEQTASFLHRQLVWRYTLCLEEWQLEVVFLLSKWKRRRNKCNKNRKRRIRNRGWGRTRNRKVKKHTELEKDLPIRFKSGRDILKEYYLKHKFLNEQDLDELVAKSNMSYEQVREWFAEIHRKEEMVPTRLKIKREMKNKMRRRMSHMVKMRQWLRSRDLLWEMKTVMKMMMKLMTVIPGSLHRAFEKQCPCLRVSDLSELALFWAMTLGEKPWLCWVSTTCPLPLHQFCLYFT